MTKFPNPISALISEQLNAVMKFYSINEKDSIDFVLIPSLINENLNSSDETISFWQTPMISGRRLAYESCLEFLSTHVNTAPIWINTYHHDNLLILEFSKRFRKINVINEVNTNNTFSPFKIATNESFDFSRIDERKSIIRALLFGALTTDIERDKINATISENEFLDFLENHFNSYRYYPQLYNHYKLGDKNYSSFVIERDFEKHTFRMFKNDEHQTELIANKSLKEIALIYLEKELNWKIGEIKIEP
jgi:hypothetical protein